jgi:ATP synthase protein I
MARDKYRPGPSSSSGPSETELSDRLRRLGERLGHEAAEGDGETAREPDQGSDPGGLGKALRLSTEFVAGVIAGAFLGWLMDRLLATSPWGLIVFLMLGFAAGVMNVMRAAGMWGGSPPGTRGN